MFSLDDYILTLKSLLEKEKDKEKRKDIILNWIELLKKHGRILEGDKIIKKIEDEWDEKEGKGIVYTPNLEQKSKLEKIFKEADAEMEWNIDPKLLAGWRIIWKDSIIDNSLQTQLHKLKNSLKE